MAEIIRAENSGFCFGVKQAIEKTEQQIYNNKDKKIYTCGPLIHNQFVIDHLASQGVGIIYEPEQAHRGDVVIVRSHGETKRFLMMQPKEVLKWSMRPVLLSIKFIS